MRTWLLLALAVVAVGCGSSGDKAGGEEDADTTVLTLATRDADEWEARFAREVARLSRGTMRIDVRADQHRDDPEYEQRIVEDVRAGKFDLADTGARVWDLLGATSFQALLAPLLVDSEELELRIIEGPLGLRMLEGLEEAGVVGIATIAGQVRRPFGTRRAFVGAADFRGARVGIRPGGVAWATFEALGATPTPYAPGAFAGLDAVELDPAVIADWGADDHGSTFTVNVALWPLPTTISMNRDSYRRLTPAQQSILRRAGRSVMRPLYEVLLREERGGLGAVCERGRLELVRASSTDLGALRAAVEPVYEMLERDPRTRELLAGIRELRTQVPAAPEPACDGGSSPEGDTSQIEGRWRAKPTAADLIAVGDNRDEARAGRGTWIVEFRAGRFTARQPATGLEYSGTYELRGDVLSADFDVCPGTVCTLISETRWSVYRDQLTLTEIPGRPFSSVGVAAPWTRIE
jgi:TRAP-type C4-dicarboxylate transport system substrate-binding protein